jgi:hypothetical protein
MVDKPRKKKRPPEPAKSSVPIGLVLGLIGGGTFLVIAVLAVGLILLLRLAGGATNTSGLPDVAAAPAMQRGAAPVNPAPSAGNVGGPATSSPRSPDESAPASAPKQQASPPAVPEPPRPPKTQLLVQGLRNGDALFLDNEELPGPGAGPDGKKELEVRDGPHQLKLTRTGHREWNWEGAVPSGQTVRVTPAPEKLRGAVALDNAPIGKPAPEIEWDDIDGKAFKLSDYKGKVVLLDFWGNW